MTKRANAVLLRRGLLLFWAVWLTVVLATNVGDALKELALLDPGWRFASGNYGFIAATTARYGVPAAVNAVLFLGVILWQGVAAGLFWRAVGGGCRYAAFTSSLMLWAAFAVADELFIAYPLEGTHLRLFIAQLVTLLVIEQLSCGADSPDAGARPRPPSV